MSETPVVVHLCMLSYSLCVHTAPVAASRYYEMGPMKDYEMGPGPENGLFVCVCVCVCVFVFVRVSFCSALMYFERAREMYFERAREERKGSWR